MFKRLIFFSVTALLLVSCNNSKKKKATNKAIPKSISENIKVYDYDGLDPLFHIKNDTTYIVNFWATWCAPCVKELPHFQDYYQNHKNEKMKMLMVSMDDPKEITTKITPFIKKKNIQQEVVILDDPDANTWIDKIDPNWSGALPFTIIYNKNNRAYFDKSFESYDDLENAVKQTIK
jgi:thiol-disulfide isomerase/thioredoxin